MSSAAGGLEDGRRRQREGLDSVSVRAVCVAGVLCASAIFVAPSAAVVPPSEVSPPPPCAVFLAGMAAPSAHQECSLVLGDTAVSCAHDKDSTLEQTYDDVDCFARLGSLLRADCVADQGTVSGAPYDASGCGLVVDGTLVLACSSEGGSPGPGQSTSRYSTCTAGPVSCAVTMYPDPRYAAPGSVTPDCPLPASRRR
jgi:hypothetical protein